MIYNDYEREQDDPLWGTRIDEGPDMDSVEDYLTGVLEALYDDGDLKKLEHCVEELCHELRTPYRYGDLKLERKGFSKTMHEHLKEQRETINKMRKNHG